MGKPHPALDCFTNGEGEKTATDERVEQVAEKEHSLPSAKEFIPTSMKVQFFPVRQFLKAVSSGKLSKCDKRFWRRRCLVTRAPNPVGCHKPLLSPFPGVCFLKAKISKLCCVYCVCAFCDFEIPTLVFLYVRNVLLPRMEVGNLFSSEIELNLFQRVLPEQ